MLTLYKEAVNTDQIKKFDNEIVFRIIGDAAPIAYRSPDVTAAKSPDTVNGKLLFEIGAFSLYGTDEDILCVYRGASKLVASISPLEKGGLDARTVKRLEDYLIQAHELDPNTVSAYSAFEKYEKLVRKTAEFCGCLTDILSEDGNAISTSQYCLSFENVNCSHIAISLPVIALMYRRISALRGFNFKVTVKDSLPCLIFSAKVLTEQTELCAIREYAALKDILGDDGLILSARFKEVGENDGAETLYRLSIAICPQTVDPRGILRAPVWRRQAQKLIESLDLDLDGKY